MWYFVFAGTLPLSSTCTFCPHPDCVSCPVIIIALDIIHASRGRYTGYEYCSSYPCSQSILANYSSCLYILLQLNNYKKIIQQADLQRDRITMQYYNNILYYMKMKCQLACMLSIEPINLSCLVCIFFALILVTVLLFQILHCLFILLLPEKLFNVRVLRDVFR